jgi:hypothetical protein
MGYWNEFLPPALDDEERIKQINHCFLVFVTGEYEAFPVEADPTQVRVVNHEGASEVYVAEQLYAALEPIGSSAEVREILVNGGLEL